MALGRVAEHSFADGHLRSDTRRLESVAGSGVETGPFFVWKHHERVTVPKEIGEGFERRAEKLVEAIAAGQPLGEGFELMDETLRVDLILSSR
jgi:hypothetical protein